jgi:Tfp pilus assembly protein PilO
MSDLERFNQRLADLRDVWQTELRRVDDLRHVTLEQLRAQLRDMEQRLTTVERIVDRLRRSEGP